MDFPDRDYDVERYLRGVRRFFEEGIPFNRLMGIRAVRIDRDGAALIMPFKEELLGNAAAGALHGGTLSALADTAGGAAVFAAADYGDVVSTIDLRIDYLQPGRRRDTFAEAEVLRMGGRVGVARIRITQKTDDGEETLIADATGVYNVRRKAF